MKNKKGFFVCEVDASRDEYIPVVSNKKNLAEGKNVIIATPGCLVGGTEVVGGRLHGEVNEGVFCSPVDMGWKGDGLVCVVLTDKAKVGDFAPSCRKSPLVVQSGSEAIDAVQDGDDQQKSRKEKASTKAKAKKGDAEDDAPKGRSAQKKKG